MSRKKSNRPLARPAAPPRWLPWLMGAGAVAALAALALLVNGGQPPAEGIGAPGLKVDREKVDLGDVRLGQTVSVTFEVTNAGDRLLRFTAAPYVEVAQGC